MSLKYQIKKHPYKSALIIMSVVFFFIYFSLYIGQFQHNYLIFNQPDESINYFFVTELLQGNTKVTESLSELTNNQVHPRSTTVIEGALVPIGFPGIIVVIAVTTTLITNIIGEWSTNVIIVSITPALAAIAPLFLYGFLKKIFNTHIAFLSSVLLFIHPAWWYYASRSLQHNTFFTVSIIVSLFFAAKALEKQALYRVYAFITGIVVGLAIYVRPAELVWVVLLYIVLFVLIRHKVIFTMLLSFSIGLVLMGVIFLGTQNVYYGHPLATGYAVPTGEGEAGNIFDVPDTQSGVESLFLPFGFDITTMARTAISYGGTLLGLWAILLLVSIVWLMWKYKSLPKKAKIYLTIVAVITIYIGTVYGSWSFFDNIAAIPTIATSYTRYFLPLYVASLPLLAIILWKIRKAHKYGGIITTVIVALLLLNSVYTVFLSPEGLYHVRKTVVRYYDMRQHIVASTPANAVIITRYDDKHIFPMRKVIPNVQEPWYKEATLALIEQDFPVYIYDIPFTNDEEQDMQDFLTQKKLMIKEPILEQYGLSLRQIMPLARERESQ